MPPLETLIAFAAATAVFAYVPGPAILYSAAQTLARGRRGGLMAALGLHLGCYLHVVAAAFGLSAVFRLVPELYVAVKIAGALYLAWLGLTMILKRAETNELPHVADRSRRRAFGESLMVEILNPKTAIFFIAFLPQFVDPGTALPAWVQFLILGTIVNFAFSSADLVTIFATSAVVGRLKHGGLGQRLMRIAGGSLLIGLGARLAMDRS